MQRIYGLWFFESSLRWLQTIGPLLLSSATKLHILVSKLRGGTSKTIKLRQTQVNWYELHCFGSPTAQLPPPACVILYHVTGSCISTILEEFGTLIGFRSIGPLRDPVTWYGIDYAGTQITPWDF